MNFGPPAQNDPPPQTPLPDPHTNTTGVKLICTCSCTEHLFSAQIQPKHLFTSFMQLMHNTIRKLQVWNQLLAISLNTPPRPTWGHSMHFYDQAPRPPLSQITQQGCQSNGFELRIPKNDFICWKWPRQILKTPPQNSEPPKMTTHQLTL